MRYKYPSTPHLPLSMGVHRDDTVLLGQENFIGKEVVVTVKMDGENTTLYPDYLHARSLDSRHHPSRDWVKGFHSGIRFAIPDGYRICGENVYAQHSIRYKDLKTYFYGFSVWYEEKCLDWATTLYFFDEVGIEPVPVLYKGVFDEKVLEKLAKEFDTEKNEGFVVRLAEEFTRDDFAVSCAKWVRQNHVQTNKHWAHQAVVPNKLR